MLEELLGYVRANKRVCPMPGKWNELWKLLPNRKQKANGGWEPALPLILAAWDHSPALVKMMRLQEHIEYAAMQEVLADVDIFLRALSEKDWFHIGD